MSDDEHRIVGAAREALLLAKDAQIARLTAERDAALALTAAAYEAAAQVAADWGDGFAQKNNHYGAAATRVAAIIRRMLPADALAAQAARDERMRAEGAKAAEARIERLVENLISAAASLAAAISLLERSGMAVKRAAPSNRMFDQMLIDYRATLESARAALRENSDE